MLLPPTEKTDVVVFAQLSILWSRDYVARIEIDGVHSPRVGFIGRSAVNVHPRIGACVFGEFIGR